MWLLHDFDTMIMLTSHRDGLRRDSPLLKVQMEQCVRFNMAAVWYKLPWLVYLKKKKKSCFAGKDANRNFLAYQSYQDAHADIHHFFSVSYG